jgi:quinol monooxygenase YgiN
VRRVRAGDRRRRHRSFQTPFGPDTFVAIEKWESAEALKAHAAAPHMKAYAAKTKDMIASRVIHVLSPAG